MSELIFKGRACFKAKHGQTIMTVVKTEFVVEQVLTRQCGHGIRKFTKIHPRRNGCKRVFMQLCMHGANAIQLALHHSLHKSQGTRSSYLA